MSSEDVSAVPTIQLIMILILLFIIMSLKSENVDLRKDLDQMRAKCEALENGK